MHLLPLMGANFLHFIKEDCGPWMIVQRKEKGTRQQKRAAHQKRLAWKSLASKLQQRLFSKATGKKILGCCPNQATGKLGS